MSPFPILIAFPIQFHSLDVSASFGVWIFFFIFPKSFGNCQEIVLKINRWTVYRRPNVAHMGLFLLEWTTPD